LTRSRTIATTSTEGAAFLKDQGHKAHNKKERETRTKKRTREAVDDLISKDAKTTSQMTEEEVAQYKENLKMSFRLFDTNHDGKIDAEELSAVFRSLGKRPTPTKINKIISEADKDKSGFVDVNEFVEYMINKKKIKATKEAEKETEEKRPAKKPAPKKPRAKKGKSEKEEEKEEEKKEEPTKKEKNGKETSEPTRPSLQRGLSIADFFTPFAGLHDEIKTTELDLHHNPAGRNYDLGHEKAFGLFSVVLFNSRRNDTQPGKNEPKTLWNEVITALQSKGFVVEDAKN